jgi:hypothetical protein
MSYDLFDCNRPMTKVLVLRFATVEAAKVHAVSLYGAFIADETDEAGNIDIFTERGVILAIEPTQEHTT